MPDTPKRKAAIIGAGPAGLTAAWELLDRTDVVPLVLEATDELGGISKTVNYKGNRIDIGGHRFFSKSDRVMDWWMNILPLQGAPARDDRLLGREVPLEREVSQRELRAPAPRKLPAPDPEKQDRVMLHRQRVSRIFFARRFFKYPITLEPQTLRNLGPVRVLRIGFSYMWTRLQPARVERSLEDFFINRFGGELYRTFFRDYTEKVWGIPCRQIKPEWGAQRIKGLSVMGVIWHALRAPFRKRSSIAQKNVETSLIEQFMYPKHGPGQMWEEVARQVRGQGGEILMNQTVVGLTLDGKRVAEVTVRDGTTGALSSHAADWVFSTMPVKDLVAAMGEGPPPDIREIATGLVYRDFITVGLLLRKMKIRNETKMATVNGIVPDNWIYIQESDVKIGRLQIFNNWSPYMVRDPDTVWIGLEYFCNVGDQLWSMPDPEFARFAIAELAKIDIIDAGDVLDQVVIRMPKTYPVYFGTYDRFAELREWINGIQNLFLIGRNGQHRYNNQDHSMLTAMMAVDCLAGRATTKDAIWDVNVEASYHEEK
jgi:protoporphyrinogen oxidase